VSPTHPGEYFEIGKLEIRLIENSKVRKISSSSTELSMSALLQLGRAGCRTIPLSSSLV